MNKAEANPPLKESPAALLSAVFRLNIDTKGLSSKIAQTTPLAPNSTIAHFLLIITKLLTDLPTPLHLQKNRISVMFRLHSE